MQEKILMFFTLIVIFYLALCVLWLMASITMLPLHWLYRKYTGNSGNKFLDTWKLIGDTIFLQFLKKDD